MIADRPVHRRCCFNSCSYCCCRVMELYIFVAHHDVLPIRFVSITPSTSLSSSSSSSSSCSHSPPFFFLCFYHSPPGTISHNCFPLIYYISTRLCLILFMFSVSPPPPPTPSPSLVQFLTRDFIINMNNPTETFRFDFFPFLIHPRSFVCLFCFSYFDPLFLKNLKTVI